MTGPTLYLSRRTAASGALAYNVIYHCLPLIPETTDYAVAHLALARAAAQTRVPMPTEAWDGDAGRFVKDGAL